MSVGTSTLVITAIGVLLAAAAIVAAVWYGEREPDAQPSGLTQEADGNDNTQVQGGGDAAGDDITKDSCLVTGKGNTVACYVGNSKYFPKAVEGAISDDEAEASIRRATAPTGAGPWPFNVLQDDQDGLFVRDSPDAEGVHVGLLPHGQVMYVACWTESTFDPEPGRGYGPRWFKVHWPTTTPQDTPLSSSPAQPAQGWAWGFYLRPNGHNGEISRCSA